MKSKGVVEMRAEDEFDSMTGFMSQTGHQHFCYDPHLFLTIMKLLYLSNQNLSFVFMQRFCKNNLLLSTGYDDTFSVTE